MPINTYHNFSPAGKKQQWGKGATADISCTAYDKRKNERIIGAFRVDDETYNKIRAVCDDLVEDFPEVGFNNSELMRVVVKRAFVYAHILTEIKESKERMAALGEAWAHTCDQLVKHGIVTSVLGDSGEAQDQSVTQVEHPGDPPGSPRTQDQSVTQVEHPGGSPGSPRTQDQSVTQVEHPGGSPGYPRTQAEAEAKAYEKHIVDKNKDSTFFKKGGMSKKDLPKIKSRNANKR